MKVVASTCRESTRSLMRNGSGENSRGEGTGRGMTGRPEVRGEADSAPGDPTHSGSTCLSLRSLPPSLSACPVPPRPWGALGLAQAGQAPPSKHPIPTCFPRVSWMMTERGLAPAPSLPRGRWRGCRVSNQARGVEKQDLPWIGSRCAAEPQSRTRDGEMGFGNEERCCESAPVRPFQVTEHQQGR